MAAAFVSYAWPRLRTLLYACLELAASCLLAHICRAAARWKFEGATSCWKSTHSTARALVTHAAANAIVTQQAQAKALGEVFAVATAIAAVFKGWCRGAVLADTDAQYTDATAMVTASRQALGFDTDHVSDEQLRYLSERVHGACLSVGQHADVVDEGPEDSRVLHTMTKPLRRRAVMSELHPLVPGITRVHLRLPLGDPSMLQPGALEHLGQQLNERFPGLQVVGTAVWKGSLLVALDVARMTQRSMDVEDEGHEQGQASRPAQAEEAVEKLRGVPAGNWLRWLGLPEHMEASVQVTPSGAEPLRCSHCAGHQALAGLPPIMLLPANGSLCLQLVGASAHGASVGTSAGAGETQGRVLRACIQGVSLDVTEQLGSLDYVIPPGTPAGALYGAMNPGVLSTIEVGFGAVMADGSAGADSEDANAAQVFQGGLLVLDSWCSQCHAVSCSASVLVLPGTQAGAAAEMMAADAAFGPHAAMTSAACAMAGAGTVPQFATTFGWWLEQTSLRTMRNEVLPGEDSQPATTAPLSATPDSASSLTPCHPDDLEGQQQQQLELLSANRRTANMAKVLYETGVRLLRLVVCRGWEETARLVLHRLMSLSQGPFGLRHVCRGNGFPRRYSMLHLAALSPNPRMLEEVWSWGQVYPPAAGGGTLNSQAAMPQWSVWYEEDADGLTPLHVAALADRGRGISTGLLQRCEEAREAWDLPSRSMRFTPAQIAQRVASMSSAAGGPIRAPGNASEVHEALPRDATPPVHASNAVATMAVTEAGPASQEGQRDRRLQYEAYCLRQHMSQLGPHCALVGFMLAFNGLLCMRESPGIGAMLILSQSVAHGLLIPYTARAHPQRLRAAWLLLEAYRAGWMLLLAAGPSSAICGDGSLMRSSIGPLVIMILEVVMVVSIQPIDLWTYLVMRVVRSVGSGAIYVRWGIERPYLEAVALFAVTSALTVGMELRCRKAFRSYTEQEIKKHQ